MDLNNFKKNIINTRIRKFIFLVFIIMLLLVAVFIFFYFFNSYNIGIPCIIETTTGLECPGCGTTRAINSLIHFNVREALEYNMLIFITIPFLGYYFISSIYAWIFDKKVKHLPPIIIIILALIIILYTIIRNII